MAFESLSDKLAETFKKLRSKGRLTNADVKEAMREVRLALLEADVSYKVVKNFTKNVTERAVGSDHQDRQRRARGAHGLGQSEDQHLLAVSQPCDAGGPAGCR